MPRIKEPKNPAPFAPVEDSPEVKSDVVNMRVLSLFDSLRKRGVSPERSAYVVSQVHASGGHNSYPKPSTQN